MKRTTVTLLIGMICLLSCDKEDVVKYQLTVRIDALDVVKDIKDLNNSDFFHNGVIPLVNSYQVRIKLLVYGKDAALVDEDTRFVDSFAEIATITKLLPAGIYTLVATADVVQKTGEQVDVEFWHFDNVTSLKELRLTDTRLNGFHGKTVGVYQNTLDVDRPASLNINIKPAGSLVFFQFYPNTVNTVSSCSIVLDKCNDYYLVNEGISYPSDYGFYHDRPDVWFVNGTNYVIMLYFMPVQNVSFMWNATVDQTANEGSITFDVEAGRNLYINTDVISGVSTVKSVILPD
jgi:hypothetical protein